MTSEPSTFVRDVPPLGRKHGELAADDLLTDGQVAKVLVERRVATEAEGQTGGEREGGGWPTGGQRSGGRVSLPDEEQDAEAPRVHSRAVAYGGGLGEDLRGQVGRRPAQGPHQHRLLEYPGLIEICHLTPPLRDSIGQDCVQG